MESWRPNRVSGQGLGTARRAVPCCGLGRVLPPGDMGSSTPAGKKPHAGRQPQTARAAPGDAELKARTCLQQPAPPPSPPSRGADPGPSAYLHQREELRLERRGGACGGPREALERGGAGRVEVRTRRCSVLVCVCDRVSLGSLSCPGACRIDQAGLKFAEIRLPPSPECWD